MDSSADMDKEEAEHCKLGFLKTLVEWSGSGRKGFALEVKRRGREDEGHVAPRRRGKWQLTVGAVGDG